MLWWILAMGIWILNAWTAEAAGVLDLSSWQQEPQRIVIQEAWEFHWEKLLEPTADHPVATEWLITGHAWNDLPRADGSRRPASGYATYKMILRNVVVRADGYQIGIKGAGAAYRLIVYPQDEPQSYQMMERGQMDSDIFQGSRRPAVMNLHPAKPRDYVILLQVRNREYAWGGVYFPVYLGTGESIRRNFDLEGFVSVLSIGIMFGVGIYSFMMWVRRREDKAALMLALVSSSGIMRLCSTSPFILERWPDQAYPWILRQEFLSMNFGVLCYLAFLIFGFRQGVFNLWDKCLTTCNAAVVGIYLVGPYLIFPYVLKLTQGLVLASSITFVIYSYRAWRQRQSGARLVLSGCLLMAFGVTFDVVSAFSSSELYITAWTVMIFLILQSQIVGLRAAEAHRRSEVLARELKVKNQEITDFNRNLEKLVEAKTKAIRSLLDHIPQGVCTVGRDGLIAKDYSAHLVDILEHQDPGLQKFDAILLSHCQLSPDQKDQIQKAMEISFGESAFNLELNRDKLPVQLVYDCGQARKHLKVTWNAQTDDEDNVEHMLITFLDVTAEKSLEQETHDQQLVLEKIKELVDQNPQRIQQFFSTAQPLLTENLRIVENSRLEPSDVRLLFVNAHTVKGAARTLHFRSLADAIHLAEDNYAMVIRGAPPQRERLLADCKAALAELESYREINRVKLNRSDDLSKIVIERDLVLNHYQAVSQCLQQEQPTIEQLMDFLRIHSEDLTKLIFEQLPTIFDGYIERATKIARDLGKADPQLHINVPVIPVAAEVRVILDNCMIHILRNALDHGIETADERKSMRKSPRGSIWIKGQVEDDSLLLEVRDDGRGLALARLRELGLRIGRLNPRSSDEDAAALIFEEGLSTSQSLTTISGRGIGMSAVRCFLQEAQGSIAVLLDPAVDSASEYRGFAFRLNLPLQKTVTVAAAA